LCGPRHCGTVIRKPASNENRLFSTFNRCRPMTAPGGFTSRPGGALRGAIRVPGDKSISHRAVMLASLATGASPVRGLLQGHDTLATVAAFQAMGVEMDGPCQEELTIRGVGLHGLSPPKGPLDMGNSGTGMRLLAGVLAGQCFASRLVGDESLSNRPMGRIAEPLRAMGARIQTGDTGTPPLVIEPAQTPLEALDYAMPVASAQIKSCLLLAGLYARGTTVVRQPGPSRDHTERMLQSFGCPVKVSGNEVAMEGEKALAATGVDIPGDLSSAAFFLVGAAITPGSELLIRDVGINPTRTGVIQILQQMGATITLGNERLWGAEPVADLRVKSGPLRGIDIPPSLVPLAIDEFPALFIAAACARGRTTLRGAAELRVKESDRIAAMENGLQSLGVRARATANGMEIDGGSIGPGAVDSRGDHRIAMAFAVAGGVARGPVTVRDCANVATSFPGFVDLAATAGLGIEAQP